MLHASLRNIGIHPWPCLSAHPSPSFAVTICKEICVCMHWSKTAAQNKTLPLHNFGENKNNLKKIWESWATSNWSKGSVGQEESRYQILSPRSWIPNPRSQIPNPKSWIPISEFWILNPRSQIPSPKSIFFGQKKFWSKNLCAEFFLFKYFFGQHFSWSKFVWLGKKLGQT